MGNMETMLGPLSVVVEVTVPDKRRRDIDNVVKALLDAMEQAGCYEDDSQIENLIVQRVGCESPGCVDVYIGQANRT